MRILGFSSLTWHNYEADKPKLALPGFTTFRFPRGDRDWGVGEMAQIVYKPRSPKASIRTVLGIAEIVKVEPRCLLPWHANEIRPFSNLDARIGGFESVLAMGKWLQATYGMARLCEQQYVINRLVLAWSQRWLYTGPSEEINRVWAEMCGGQEYQVNMALAAQKPSGQ